MKPACAQTCPTESIKFGEIEELREIAAERMKTLAARGMKDAQFYDASDSSVGGTHAMFIVRGDPRAYNLPPTPEVPTVYLKKAWRSSAIGALLLLGLFRLDSSRLDAYRWFRRAVLVSLLGEQNSLLGLAKSPCSKIGFSDISRGYRKTAISPCKQGIRR